LETIYADWWLYLNFFQPVRKLVAKERLKEIYEKLNPAALRRRIEDNLERLWRLHG